MKRIRIGKDISMRWEITTDGVAIPLEGRDLTVEIKSPIGIVSNIPYRVDGNSLIMTYYGAEQKRVGEYSITLWENKGKTGQNVVDAINAFELVRTSPEEEGFIGGDLQVECVDLGTENFDILTEGGYRAINIDTLQADALKDSVNIKGKTYSNESFTITLPKANLDSAGVMSADDKQTLQEHGNSISQLESTTSGHSNAISQINAKLDEHTESINAKISTGRIEDGAVTSEKIATSAFDSTLSVSGKIAPADVVGGKLNELDKQVIYDITANNNGETFASLSALLSSENLSTLIPYAVRCGGMSIRFVQSSDNKYVQYMYMLEYTNNTAGNAAFVNPNNWQKINLEEKVDSLDLTLNGEPEINLTLNLTRFQYYELEEPIRAGRTIYNNSSYYLYIYGGNTELEQIIPNGSKTYDVEVTKIRASNAGTYNVVVNKIKSVNEKIGDVDSKINGLISAGYVYAGTINVKSTPTPNVNDKVFYIPTQQGIYTNFSNISIGHSEFSIIRPTFKQGQRSWVKEVIANYLPSELIFGFRGIATQNTNPSLDFPLQAYLVPIAGTYTNFGGLTVKDGELALLRTTTSGGVAVGWVKETLATYTPKDSGYLLMGMADTTTTPTIPDGCTKVYYIASEAGTYTNFGNVVVPDNKLSIIRSTVVSNNIVWVVDSMDISIYAAYIEQAVTDWFDKHPEATTTVQDDSITIAKLASDLKDIQYLDLRGNDGGSTVIGQRSGGNGKYGTVAVGNNNLPSSTGKKNVTVGNDNMSASDTGLTPTGNRNTSMGYHALYRLTLGDDNATFGAESGDDNTSGKQNTAIGAYSLQRNTQGDNNVAVGFQAMKGYPDVYTEGTKCYDNVAIGKEALKGARTGMNDNIAIGSGAMKSDTSHSNCIAIGKNASVSANNQISIGTTSHTEIVVLGNKKLIFNNDGTVTWTTLS